MRDAEVEVHGRVRIVVLACDLRDGDLDEWVFIVDEEFLLILCLFSNNDLRREMRDDLRIGESHPVLHHILGEGWILLGLL